MLRVAPAIVVVSEIRFDRIFEGDGFDGGGAFGCVLGFRFGLVDLYRVDALLDFLTFFVSQLARLFERNCTGQAPSSARPRLRSRVSSVVP
jgi:hypothetical protein